MQRWMILGALVLSACGGGTYACVATDENGVDVCMECGKGFCGDVTDATSLACDEKTIDDQQSACGQLGFDSSYSACSTLTTNTFLTESGGLIATADCPTE